MMPPPTSRIKNATLGLTQNWESMALRTLTTIDSFYFIMGEDPHE